MLCGLWVLWLFCVDVSVIRIVSAQKPPDWRER